MKSICFFILLILCSCSAQVVPLDYDYSIDEDNSSYYFKDLDNDLDKYVGTWLYENNSESFLLELEIVENFDMEELGKKDKLMGNYRYTVNGIERINTLDNVVTQGSTLNGYHFEMLNFRKNSPTNFIFEDPINSKWTGYRSKVTYLNEDILLGEQIEVQTMITDFMNPDNDPNASQILRIPETMILTKID